jgi:hypothetical protein
VGESIKLRLFFADMRYGSKSKAIPVTGRGGPYGCGTSRLPHFLDNRLTDGGKVVRFTRRPPFNPERFVVLISERGGFEPRAIVQLEGLGELRNPMASIKN